MDSFLKLAALATCICMAAAGSGAKGPSGAGTHQRQEPANAEVWRDLEHGGFNAVYFLLRVCGDAPSYSECLTRLRGGQLPQTLAAVLAPPQGFGLPFPARFPT